MVWIGPKGACEKANITYYSRNAPGIQWEKPGKKLDGGRNDQEEVMNKP
jgi:hypothetical protein